MKKYTIVMLVIFAGVGWGLAGAGWWMEYSVRGYLHDTQLTISKKDSDFAKMADENANERAWLVMVMGSSATLDHMRQQTAFHDYGVPYPTDHDFEMLYNMIDTGNAKCPVKFESTSKKYFNLAQKVAEGIHGWQYSPSQSSVQLTTDRMDDMESLFDDIIKETIKNGDDQFYNFFSPPSSSGN